jgi:hypothetical protein
MNLWDDIQEPALALHLHNMVVKKAYLQKEVGLYSTIEDLFESSFFPNGIANDNFSDALVAQTVLGRNDRSSLHQRQALVRNTSKDIYQLLNLSLDRFFKTKAGFMMYYDADWVPEKIPDSAVRIPSLLYLIRLINTERVVDPTTGEKRLKETELVTRPKALGQSELHCCKQHQSQPRTRVATSKKLKRIWLSWPSQPRVGHVSYDASVHEIRGLVSRGSPSAVDPSVRAS